MEIFVDVIGTIMVLTIIGMGIIASYELIELLFWNYTICKKDKRMNQYRVYLKNKYAKPLKFLLNIKDEG